ncbi:hypothetical protein LFM09_42125 [Lentzea alba]|uniref:hypothetical protein n=1 Tax=Lentzea alba TaxID=2714351 RepID=UPI0039BFBEF5
MKLGQIRSRGLQSLAVGAGLVVLVTLIPVLLPVETGSATLAAVVFAVIMCLCAAVAGGMALLIADEGAAARLRRWFVVLEGVGMSSAFPLLAAALGMDVPGREGNGDVLGALSLTVPSFVSAFLVFRVSYAVHMVATDANGPLVPGDGSGAPALQLRLLGRVLLVLGLVLGINVWAVPAATGMPARIVFAVVLGTIVTLCAVVLGAMLMRVTDVSTARRVKVGWVCAGSALSITAVGPMAGSKMTAVGVLYCALVFGGVVLVVIGTLVLRGYTGAWDRPWRPVSR